MEFRILGPFDVTVGGEPLALGGAKQRGVLAALVLRAGSVVPRERLIDQVWGEDAPPSALGTLHAYVSRLRRALRSTAADDDEEQGGRLTTVGHGYLLRAERDEIDANRFEDLAAKGRERLEQGDAEAAARDLCDALALWQGEVLDGFADAPFASAVITRLEDARAVALEDRIEADLACGRHADVLGELASLVELHPLRERFRGQFMVALYRSGRQAEALTAYEETRAYLSDELGIDPSEPVRTLHTRILQQDESLVLPRRERRFPSAVVVRTEATRLPLVGTSFIGRDALVDEITTHVAATPIVTLTGLGGSGKTRLATEVARSLAAPAATVYVDLSTSEDDARVWPVIAAAMGLVTDSGHEPRDGVLAALTEPHDGDRAGDASPRLQLLLLDSAERVVDRIAPVLAELAAVADDHRPILLVTSRIPVGIAGEKVVRVGPLDLGTGPDGRCSDAAELFLARWGGDPAAAEIPTVEAIVQRVDGVPLGIELAASRAATLGLDGLLASLGSHLDRLGSDRRDRPARHRTLGASIDWSVDLLQPGDRTVLLRLHGFVGGFSLEAAERVGADEHVESTEVIDAVTRLANASLVVPVDGPDGRRFRMLEVIRARASALLALDPERDAHARRAFLDWAVWQAEQARDGLHGRDRDVWKRRVDRDHDNLLAALEVARQHDVADVRLALAARLWPYWRRTAWVAEGQRILDEVVTEIVEVEEVMAAAAETGGSTDGIGRLRSLAVADDVASVAHGRGILAVVASEFGEAKAHLEHAYVVAATDLHRAWIAVDLATACLWSGEQARAEQVLEGALAAFGVARSDAGEAAALRTRARLLHTLGRIEDAHPIAERALAMSRVTGDRRASADAGAVLALVLAGRGQADEAARVAAEAVGSARSMGDRPVLLVCLYSQVLVASVVGDAAMVEEAGDEVDALAAHLGVPAAALPAEISRARVASAAGEHAAARERLVQTRERARVAGMHDIVSLCDIATARVARRQDDLAMAERTLASAARLTVAHGLAARVGEVCLEAGLQLGAGVDLPLGGLDAAALFSAGTASGVARPYLFTRTDEAEVADAVTAHGPGKGEATGTALLDASAIVRLLADNSGDVAGLDG